MKNITKILSILPLFFAFATLMSCEKEGELYKLEDPSKWAAPVLQLFTIDGNRLPERNAIVVDKDNIDSSFVINHSVSEGANDPNKFQISFTYTLFVEHEGARAAVSSTMGEPLAEIRYRDLNNALGVIGLPFETLIEVKFYVEATVGSNPNAKNFVRSNLRTYEVSRMRPIPDFLRVVGDGTSADSWDANNGTRLYRVNSNSPAGVQDAHLFIGIVWLEATGSLRFVEEIGRTFGDGFGQAGANGATIDDYSEFAIGSGTIPVPGEAGYYTIIVDIKDGQQAISIVEPEIYAMGGAFGGWNEGEFAFTVDNDAKTISSPVAVADGNFRAYVYHPWVAERGITEWGTWWRTEFNVVGDNIVWRTTQANIGDDPAAFSITAGQKVVFDFIEGKARRE
jgi:hypothetical protein